jgi:hypothetical protein
MADHYEYYTFDFPRTTDCTADTAPKDWADHQLQQGKNE